MRKRIFPNWRRLSGRLEVESQSPQFSLQEVDKGLVIMPSLTPADTYIELPDNLAILARVRQTHPTLYKFWDRLSHAPDCDYLNFPRGQA